MMVYLFDTDIFFYKHRIFETLFFLFFYQLSWVPTHSLLAVGLTNFLFFFFSFKNFSLPL